MQKPGGRLSGRIVQKLPFELCRPCHVLKWRVQMRVHPVCSRKRLEYCIHHAGRHAFQRVLISARCASKTDCFPVRRKIPAAIGAYSKVHFESGSNIRRLIAIVIIVQELNQFSASQFRRHIHEANSLSSNSRKAMRARCRRVLTAPGVIPKH